MSTAIRFASILSVLFTFIGAARAAPADPAETLQTLVGVLEEYQSDMVLSDEDRAAVIAAFDDAQPSAKNYKKLAAELKKSVAREVAQRNKDTALVYKIAVRELKAGKATKQQLKEAAAEYSLTLSRVKDGRRAFDVYVDRVSREYTRAL